MLDRPDWDEYFLAIAFLVAQRSFDPSTKCGCVFVDDCNSILSTGYNGPVRGSNDLETPIERPDKYLVMEHSERNAIYTAARNGVSLKGSKVYVTGVPCMDCLRGLLQVGAKELIYAQNTAVMNAVIHPLHQKLLDSPLIKVKQIKNECFYDLFTKTKEYCISKIPFQ